jgi:hypothetical protein
MYFEVPSLNTYKDTYLDYYKAQLQQTGSESNISV